MVKESERVADLRRALGARLAEFRVAAALTQARLAELVYSDRTRVTHIEKGRTRADEQFWRVADDACRAGGVLLAGFHEVQAAQAAHEREVRATELAEAQDKVARLRKRDHRPTAPSPIGAFDPGRELDPAGLLGRLTMRVQLPRRIGWAEVEQVRLMTGTLAAGENLYGGAVAGEVGATHLRWAARLLSAQAAAAVEAGMYEAVGNLAGVVAYSAFDVGGHDAAARCFRFGLRCAEHSGSWELRAAILSDMTRQAIYLGNLDDARSLIEFAQVRADRLTATTRAMIAVIHARLLAMMGRQDEARAAVDRADTHFARREAATDPPWLVYYDEAEHAGSSARALIPLAVDNGRPGDAAERLAMAVRLHSAAYPRSRAFSRTRLATLHMAIGDPREAVDIGRQAVADAAMVNSRRMDEELAALTRASEPRRSIPEVAEFLHLVASATTYV
jgi:transcriptional regulator with XRE-family HTH domain